MSAQQPNTTGRGTDFDALADLFLGEQSQELCAHAPTLRLTESADDAELTSEILLLGHLPVRANPWVAQYARLLAEREQRPVALLRMGDGQLGIDLYGLDTGGRGFRECHAETEIDGALKRLAKMSAHLLFQVSDINELELARSHESGRVTILTAANDAAVVNVYKTMKSLAGELDEIGIAVMGDSEERARAALAKLGEATRAFLNVRMTERGIIDRMGPTGGAMVFLGECDLSHQQVVARVEQLRTAEAVAPKLAEQGELLSPPLSRSEWEELSPAAHSTNGAPAPSQQAVQRHTAAVHEETRDGRHQDSRELASDAPTIALSMLELKPIGALCPDDEGVTIARDEAGAMHLVVQDEARRGIERLTAVSAWACKHAKILSTIDRALIEDEAVVLHLLTEHPKDVRHLLDCDVRVHAMTRADERIGTGWCFLELN